MTVMPSAPTPTVPACDTRTRGGTLNEVTSCALCGLWQSTQVAWRLLLSTAASLASCWLLPLGKGWLILLYSAKTLGAAGERFDPMLWQDVQADSFCPRSRRTAPGALCGA